MHIARTGLSLAPVEAAPSPQRIDETARKLESQFTQMLVKCMREASLGDPLFPEQNQTYRDLYDRQLSDMLSQGKGLGLAPLIARQLQGATSPAHAGQADGASPLTAQDASSPRSQAALDPRFAAAGDSVATLDAIAGRTPSSATDVAAIINEATAGNDAASACDQLETLAETDPAAFASGSPEHFVASIWPHARRAADELGVDPRALVAQAALETGWGRRGIRDRDGSSAHNLFGIKASGWSGQRISTSTHEYVNGQRRSERADFRAYASPADSFADYVRLLKSNPRYQRALEAGEDVRRFASELQRAGYATDPAYARKIQAIANGPTLERALGRASATLVASARG